MIIREIEGLETRLKSILVGMFQQNKFEEITRAMRDVFEPLPLGAGSYQLLFKSQARGFGNAGEAPFSVNLLGMLSTAVTSDSQGVRRLTVEQMPLDLASPEPCSHCNGSGLVLDRSAT